MRKTHLFVEGWQSLNVLAFFLYLSWPEGGYLIYSTHEYKTHSTGNEGNGPYDCEINWDGLSLAIHDC